MTFLFLLLEARGHYVYEQEIIMPMSHHIMAIWRQRPDYKIGAFLKQGALWPPFN